ncbi:DUF3737 family protein [Lapidilactobacillus luobeiensis]|uniref:DUF3737 family protein n=1 Tax=Lapidilactobacillus luobeiensis TaxID=2950371 RepID=UPI0021C42DBC|nr:DUF3737 family protein [Lapidilactobacillus luobeiensis]
MSEIIKQQYLTGERALFQGHDLAISETVFANGESPLKESHDLILNNDTFEWKYPLWYSQHIQAQNLTLLEMARSGIWYTKDIAISDSLIQAPKNFRRSEKIKLTRVELTHAEETLWNCRQIELDHVTADGDYFGMNSQQITADHLAISGNYLFDGGRDIVVDHARLIAKDAFWNCENVVIKNSTIIGEYFGWNSRNVTLINCTIESHQGFCYMENLKLENCRLLNTDLAFEYSTVDATIQSKINSVKNPISGRIEAAAIEQLIFDDPQIDPTKTTISTTQNKGVLSDAI